MELGEYWEKDVDTEIDSSVIEPYQHEPVEEDMEELVANGEEESMSDDEGSQYKGTLKNLDR